jgi:hypothetical protein
LRPEEATRRAPRLAILRETDQRQIGAVEHHVGAEGWRAEAKMIAGTPGVLKAMPLIAVNGISGTRHDASAAWNRSLIDTTSVGMMHTPSGQPRSPPAPGPAILSKARR